MPVHGAYMCTVLCSDLLRGSKKNMYLIVCVSFPVMHYSNVPC
jgi:hypothetical protein